MKKACLIILTLCFCLSLAACSRPSDDEIKTVRKVSFEGTELTVTLGTNQSTGYEWDFEIYGDCIEQSINKKFKITGTHGDATGEVSIGFQGLSEGSAVILLTTPWGWDGTGTGDAYTVNVTVGTDGAILDASGEEGDTSGMAADSAGLLSAPYAKILMSGDYQYTYAINYEGKDYTVLVAAKNGMASRSVIADDGSYRMRFVTIDANTWQIDENTGAVMDIGEQPDETLPDYGASLAFAEANTLDTGAINETYDFEHEGQKCKMVFVFSADGDLVELMPTIGENTTHMDILEIKAVSDRKLFDAPQ